MPIQEKDCYKKGLLGTTINDVSSKMNYVSDVIDWLNIMYSLACEDKSNKKDDRGMKCLKNAIGDQRLDANDYKNFQNLIKLVEILDKIKVGSEKAWRGRTKQKGFKNTLIHNSIIVRALARQAFCSQNEQQDDYRSSGLGMLWESIRIVINKSVIDKGIMKTLNELVSLIKKSIGNKTIKPSEYDEILKRLGVAFSPYSIPERVKDFLKNHIAYASLGEIDFAKCSSAFKWLNQEWANSFANKESIEHQFKFEDIRKCDIAKINAICDICEKNYERYEVLSEVKPSIGGNLYYLKDLYKLLSTLYNLFSKNSSFAKTFILNLDKSISWTNARLKDTVQKLSDAFGKNNASLLDFIKNINPNCSVSNDWKIWINKKEKTIKKLCTNNEDKNLVDKYWSAEGLPNN